MSDYQRGTGVREYPPIIGRTDDQISLCLRMHIISFKTDAGVLRGSGNYHR